MSFASMKKNRSNFSELQKKLEGDNKQSYKDERSFYPQLDEQKNGSAVIRFLPASEGDDDQPWVKMYSHGFKDNGGWFIEECPTTIGGECPVCVSNSESWRTGLDSDKSIARARKRSLKYISNVLVIEDKKNPENEGKVFLFKYGVKIFDKIKDSMFPEFDDETPVNIFDPWEGANFRLKIRKLDGQINYDKSSFEAPSALFDGDDKKIENAWNSQYKLSEEIAQDKYKSVIDLAKRFGRVTGEATATASASEMIQEAVSSPTQSSLPPTSSPDVKPEEDDALDFLRKLAEE